MAHLRKSFQATKNFALLVSRFSSGSENVIKGKVFDKKPVKVLLEKDKTYKWCTCGLSKTQPFCDHSHKELNAKTSDTSKHMKSHKFTMSEAKEYHLCNCKQTKKPPFCDGIHKEKFIQDLKL